MPRVAALSLDAATVAKLIKGAQTVTAAPREHADGSCPGLTLRVSPKSCAWYARAKWRQRQIRVRLGDAREWSLAEARAVCVDVRRHVALGAAEPAREWIEAKRSEHARTARLRRGGGHAREPWPLEPLPEIMPRTRPQPRPTWTFAEAREAWIAWMRGEVAAGALRPATMQNYRSVMNSPALRDALDGRKVSEIGAASVARVVEKLATEGKRSTARDIVRVGRRMWRWMGAPARSADSGADPKELDGLAAPKLGTHKLKGRRRFPRVDEVARMVSVAQYGILDPTTAAAVELLCHTAQRRLSVAKARREEFEDWAEREGWGVWWEGHRKIDRGSPTADDARHGAHAIPLPPLLWLRIMIYMSATKAAAERRGEPWSPWLFPAKGRAGHINPHTLSHAVAAIPGVQASPHDVRRAFATVLQRDHDVSSAHVGMILDHANSDLLQVTDSNGMTSRYTGDQMLRLKAPVMQAWCDALDAAAAKDRATLPDFDTLKAEFVENNRRQRGAGARGGKRKAAASEVDQT